MGIVKEGEEHFEEHFTYYKISTNDSEHDSWSKKLHGLVAVFEISPQNSHQTQCRYVPLSI